MSHDQDLINDGFAEDIPADVISVEDLPACCQRAGREVRNATGLCSFNCPSCAARWQWINAAWLKAAA